MKTNVAVFLFLLGAPLFAGAQLSEQECMTQLSIFAENCKVKNYDAAYEPWMKVRKNCPQLNVATYIYGERILEHKIEHSSGPQKDEYINDLVNNLYDEWAKYFPKDKKGVSQVGDILAHKGEALDTYGKGSKKQIYDVFDKAYTTDKASIDNPKLLYLYFAYMIDLQEAGQISLEDLFNTYEELTESFDGLKEEYQRKLDGILTKENNNVTLTSTEANNKEVYETNIVAIDKFQTNMNTLVERYATCETLIPLYAKTFEQNKTNAAWLSRAANRMEAKECLDDPMYVKLVESLDKLEPSANSKYFLFVLYYKKNDMNSAIKYLKESLELEKDDYKKADKYYKAGVIYEKLGQKSTARNYAMESIKLQPSKGNAYMLIARLIGESANECGSDEFEKKAVYWLAAEWARKGGRMDPSVKTFSNKLADSYDQRAPSKTDIFQKGMMGKTVTFNCWVGGSVKVPDL